MIPKLGLITKFLLFIICYLLLTICFSSSCYAAEYIVAQDGSGHFTTIQAAADNVSPGDTVIVKIASYPDRVIVSQSGNSGSPIIFQGESTPQAGGINSVITKGFTVTGNYIQIKNFYVASPDFSWTHGFGINFQGDYNLAENNFVYDCVCGGSNISGSNNEIKNNWFYRNGITGIKGGGTNSLIEGNEIWETIQLHPKWLKVNGGPYDDYPGWVDADGMRFFGSGHTIKGNYTHDISFADPLNVDPHIDCFQTWNSVEDGGPGHDIVFEQNFCDLLETQTPNENGHGFMLSDAYSLVIRNNIIKAYGGINTGSGINHHLTIVNNVFVNDLSFQSFYPGAIGLEGVPNTIVKNNIFYNQPYHTIVAIGDTTGQEIDYNLAYNSDGSTPDCFRVGGYVCKTPSPAHDLWGVDPKFVNPANDDFHLQSDSPAIDAGVTIAQVTNDYDGNSRPQEAGYDIGAYEYVSEVSPSPPPSPDPDPDPDPEQNIGEDNVVNLTDEGETSTPADESDEQDEDSNIDALPEETVTDDSSLDGDSGNFPPGKTKTFLSSLVSFGGIVILLSFVLVVFLVVRFLRKEKAQTK